jgi:hypothetical protein
LKTSVPVQTPVRGLLLPSGHLLLARSVAVNPYELDILLSRHDAATGALDASFENAGEFRIDLGPGNDSPLALAIQPSGKVLVGGRTWQPHTGADYFLLRLPTGP